ncbi:MAG: ATP-binding protein [Anaerolineales bacterium]
MKQPSGWRPFQGDIPLVAIALATLVLCGFYSYAGIAWVPNATMGLDGRWSVVAIDACDQKEIWCSENLPRIQIGDQITQIGNLTYEEYLHNRLAIPFEGYEPGNQVPVTLIRDEVERTIQWTMPPAVEGFRPEYLFTLWLFLPFWLAGTIALLFLRPRDDRWRVLIAFYYVIAIWLATGLFSTTGVAGVAVAYLAATWLLAPTFLHLHAVVPVPLSRPLVRVIVPGLYLGTVALIVADLAGFLPRSLYTVSIIVGTLGSLGLLLYQLTRTREPQVRLAASLMLTGIGLSFLPGVILWIIPTLLDRPIAEGLTTLFFGITLPALPLFYSYATYKRSLGALEFRANRLLSAYSFGLIYLTAFIVVLFVAGAAAGLPLDTQPLLLAVAAVFIVLAPASYGRFQQLVNLLAYGSHHNPEEILRVLASRIPTARDRDALVRILAEEIAPSLLIRQSALFLLDKAGTDGLAVYARDLTAEDLAHTGTGLQLDRLLADPKRYRPPTFEPTTPAASDWVRLVIPIQIQDKTLGVWLLGRRDPDDFYPQPDIALLGAIASQIAPAIENMRLYDSLRQQAEELASLYRASGGLFNPGAGLKRLADEIAHTITREFDVADCGVMIVDDAQIELQRFARAGTFPVIVANAPLPLVGRGLSVSAFKRGEVVYAPDVAADPRYLANNSATRSELVIPLKAGDSLIGVLDLQSPVYDAFNERTRRILITFAERAALALENARLLENLTRARRLAEEANQLKSEFLANTSHELRTPLAGILGSLSLVLDGMCETPVEEREFVATAHNSARTLLHVVNDILDIAKLEAGRMEFMVQPVHINLALAEVQSLTRSQAEAKGLALDFILSVDDPIALADHDRLRQILLNLLGNAVKFTERGSVTVRAVTTHENQIQISVQDTGIGIAAEKQTKLFQPFVQVDGSSTRRYGGTGLGLSISQRLANILGGALTFHSAGEGQGSTFILTLPVAPASDHSPSDFVPFIAEPTRM